MPSHTSPHTSHVAHPVGDTQEAHPVSASEMAEYRAAVQRGLRQLDAGQKVSSSALQAWADSLFTGAELPFPTPFVIASPKT
jgi:predicted transcriptional regulator